MKDFIMAKAKGKPVPVEDEEDGSIGDIWEKNAEEELDEEEEIDEPLNLDDLDDEAEDDDE